jgi:hypothetical protein
VDVKSNPAKQNGRASHKNLTGPLARLRKSLGKVGAAVFTAAKQLSRSAAAFEDGSSVSIFMAPLQCLLHNLRGISI